MSKADEPRGQKMSINTVDPLSITFLYTPFVLAMIFIMSQNMSIKEYEEKLAVQEHAHTRILMHTHRHRPKGLFNG